MACRLAGARPLFEPVLESCWLDPWEQTSMKSQSKFRHFHSRKSIQKCCLENGGHLVSASTCKNAILPAKEHLLWYKTILQLSVTVRFPILFTGNEASCDFNIETELRSPLKQDLFSLHGNFHPDTHDTGYWLSHQVQSLSAHDSYTFRKL